jgi:hypothetical protein
MPTMFHLLTTVNSIHVSIQFIQMSWKSDTTECSTSAVYLDILLTLDTNSKLTRQLHDKGDDFNFSIVNFAYLYNNIPSSPAYGV